LVLSFNNYRSTRSFTLFFYAKIFFTFAVQSCFKQAAVIKFSFQVIVSLPKQDAAVFTPAVPVSRLFFCPLLRGSAFFYPILRGPAFLDLIHLIYFVYKAPLFHQKIVQYWFFSWLGRSFDSFLDWGGHHWVSLSVSTTVFSPPHPLAHHFINQSISLIILFNCLSFSLLNIFCFVNNFQKCVLQLIGFQATRPWPGRGQGSSQPARQTSVRPGLYIDVDFSLLSNLVWVERNRVPANPLWAHCYDNWLRTGRYRVQSLAWAKSLIPGFDLINHFFEMINSVRIDWPNLT